MSNNIAESIIGAIVLIVAGSFLWFAYVQSNLNVGGGYVLQARFDKIDGLNVGSDVRLGGIKVGAVVAQELDPQTFQAVVRFSVDEQIELPVDTAAAITSDGLFGGKYLTLSPGGMADVLIAGDEISETQDALDLIGLISKFMFASDPDEG